MVRSVALSSLSSMDPRQTSPRMRYDEIDPACYDPKKRIEAMDIDGVGATLLFPSAGGAVSSIHDEELYLACMSTYNDAVMEWAREASDRRVFPAAQIPCVGIEHAMAELERVAKMGFRHYAFNQWPSGSPYPSPADDPFWSLLQETGLIVSFHGFGYGRPSTSAAAGGVLTHKNTKAVSVGGQPQEMIAALRGAGLGATLGLGMLALSGVLERFPALRFGMIETSVGWFPTFMERLDDTFSRHRFLVEPGIGRLPSELLGRFRISMDREWMGLKWRHSVGVDNLMFGTDFPHIGNFYPHSRFYIELAMQDVPYEEKEKILWSNGASLYGID